MILYSDSSALVKAFHQEEHSAEVIRWLAASDAVGSSLLARAEVAAGLSRALRMGRLTSRRAEWIAELFRIRWDSLIHLDVTEDLVTLADTLAWRHGLRGCDAVHLATALGWQARLAAPVVFAAFGRALLRAAEREGLSTLPEPPYSAG